MTQNKYLYILQNLCVIGYNVHCDHSKGLHPKAAHSYYVTSSPLMSAQANNAPPLMKIDIHPEKKFLSRYII